jgi:hypothetical protein
MAMWLYQLSQEFWHPNNYRLDIWEGERWKWEIGSIKGQDRPNPGDTVAFFYAPSGCDEPGFYGWAVIQLWQEEAGKRFYFRPVSPSDQLKMHPWWDENAAKLAKEIRGKFARRTLWRVSGTLAEKVAVGINSWVSGKTTS